MPVAVTILMVALFASGIGAPSLCAALCASAAAGAPQTRAGGHHDHHAGHGGVPDTAAVSATPCIDYNASGQFATAPRPQVSATMVTVASQESPRTISADGAAVALAVSPPEPVPLPDPPLRI